MNIGKWSLVKNIMLVCLVKNFFDFGHSGCRQGPISAKKRFAQNGVCLNFFSKIALILEIIFLKQKTVSQIFDMLEKRPWYIMGAKKISKKSSGRPPFWAKHFLALIGPWWHPEWPKSKKFFAKQTSMMFLTNDHSPILVFWLNLSSRAITKKSSKNA